MLDLPKTVFSDYSPISGEIKVIDVGDERRLSVGGYVQSVYPLDGNWESFSRRVWGYLRDASLKNHCPKKILLLGLGGGTFLHLLANALPEAKIICVEIDEQIVEVAKKYFDLAKAKNVKLVIADAAQVVAKPAKYLGEEKFDTVIVDIYLGGQLPPFSATADFYSSVRKLLAPGGKAIFNRIFTIRDEASQRAFLAKLARHFSNLEMTAVPNIPSAIEGNFIFSGYYA
ncbi:MAG: fused MFS/spermidine synthase [bacterium]|nr:fused MFS/spermidine synthase [bacterium]